jgi:hypothetical protein
MQHLSEYCVWYLTHSILHRAKKDSCEKYNAAMKELYEAKQNNQNNQNNQKIEIATQKVKELEQENPWLKLWAHKKATRFFGEGVIYRDKKQEVVNGGLLIKKVNN